jgi:hypothetical protein
MYERPIDRALNSAPLGKWSFIHENCMMVWIFKTPECRACIQENIRKYDKVYQWKCTVSRVSNGVSLTGLIFSGSNLNELKKNCEEEIKFLESICYFL